MGGCEWPRPPLPCIIVTQAISCLEVWEEKKKKIQGGGRGVGAAATGESGGPEGLRVARGCRLSPSSPQGCQACEPGQRNAVSCSFTLGYLEGPRRSGGRFTHATQRWGRGYGRRDCLPGHSSPRAHRSGFFLLCKTTAELSSRPRASGIRCAIFFILLKILVRLVRFHLLLLLIQLIQLVMVLML